MTRKKVLQVGVVGSVVAALCCFTPVLVWLLAALGLSAYVGYLDLILFPVLIAFLAITGYAIWRQRRAQENDPPADRRGPADGE